MPGISLEIGRDYVTRLGHEVRVYATDGGGPHPVHGAAKINGIWIACQWDDNGFSSDGYEFDIIIKKPIINIRAYLNVVLHKDGTYVPDFFINEADAIGTAYGGGGSKQVVRALQLSIFAREGHGL